MSMILGLVTIGDENIQRLLANPRLVWQLVAPDEPDVASESSAPVGLIGRLFGRSAPTPPPLVLGEGEGADTDLDKAWHGLHYLFTGTADDGDPPMNFLVAGGTQVGDEDVGYGPARVFTSAQVHSIQAAVSALDPATLRSRFKPQAMADQNVYPSEIWLRPPEEDDSFAYLMEYFEVLHYHLNLAVTQHVGLIITLG